MHGIFPAQRNEDGNNDDVTEPPKIELPKQCFAGINKVPSSGPGT
jgi:hypothetical protein